MAALSYEVVTCGLILLSIFLAHFPNLKVDKEISKSNADGEIHKIKRVLELPPKLDLNILVNGEFL